MNTTRNIENKEPAALARAWLVTWRPLLTIEE
jgi:hypothetical protein